MFNPFSENSDSTTCYMQGYSKCLMRLMKILGTPLTIYKVIIDV